jgi:energy-converting hydrogenase Eha subunit F
MQKLRAVFLSFLSLGLVLSPVSVDAATKVLTKPAPKVTVQTIKPQAPKNAPAALPVKNNGTYINAYGNMVLRPYKAPAVPAGASAKCWDGTFSFSQTRRGTCSHHGGVAEWL